ncbi:SDR family oxidoreductase [Streptomyces sp. NPDC058534]|uniref:SDR family oxidoreductase n=1 Tax=Streptomyces sp. NPDC058534 TaxID=3346541 RepID=UPI003646DE4F
MSAGLLADPAMRKVMDDAVPMPLHGHASPEDVARVVGFLLSPGFTHVTGQVLYVVRGRGGEPPTGGPVLI